MKTKPKNRKVRFMHKDGCLVRIVTAHAGGGRTYPYRCTKDIFETVAWAMAETPREGTGTTRHANRPPREPALHPGHRGPRVPEGTRDRGGPPAPLLPRHERGLPRTRWSSGMPWLKNPSPSDSAFIQGLPPPRPPQRLGCSLGGHGP